MALQDSLNDLKSLDLNNLDFQNIGAWPAAAKGILYFLVFALCLGGGYYLRIEARLQELETVTAKEESLKTQFKQKAFKAANLKALRKQMEQIQESFGALLSQLPSDTEVPGLLEDITDKAITNGLEITEIKLNGEKFEEFYVELPISIAVKGSYHDLAGFVSGIAGMPRIVTLHDYQIKPLKEKGNNSRLGMQITAKTYRYKGDEE